VCSAEEEKDIESHKASGQAATLPRAGERHKAKLGMDQAQQSLDKMRVIAPMTAGLDSEEHWTR